MQRNNTKRNGPKQQTETKIKQEVIDLTSINDNDDDDDKEMMQKTDKIDIDDNGYSLQKNADNSLNKRRRQHDDVNNNNSNKRCRQHDDVNNNSISAPMSNNNNNDGEDGEDKDDGNYINEIEAKNEAKADKKNEEEDKENEDENEEEEEEKEETKIADNHDDDKDDATPFLVASIQTIGVWQKLIRVVAGIVQVTNFEFYKEGMVVRTLFTNNAGFLYVYLKQEAFANYHLTKPSVRVGQPFAKLEKVFKYINPKSTLQLALGGQAESMVYKVIDTENGGIVTRKRFFKAIDAGEPDICDFQTYQHAVKVDSDQLHRMLCNLASNGATQVLIAVSGRRTSWSIKDVDGDETVHWWHQKRKAGLGEKPNHVSVLKRTTSAFQMLFGLAVLQTATKNYFLGKNAKLFFDTNSNLKIMYDLDNGFGHVSFIVAPQIE